MLASNQQFAPALIPARTTPAAEASRSATSTPWARQTASMLTVLPPPTYTTSWSPRNAVMSATSRSNSRRTEASKLASGNASWKAAPLSG